MRKALRVKLKESVLSVFPVVLIVLALSLTPLVSLTLRELLIFIGCAVFLILGIGLFNLGADLAMTPMGSYVGSGLTKTKKIKILVLVAFVMGVLITVAEPDLSVLAGQVSAVMNGTLLIFMVGLGVGLMLLISVLKIVFHKDLSILLMFFYMVMFTLTALLLQTGRGSLLSLSFDSGGVTTGPITVPFIMALGVGIASTIGGRDANENSFGLIALCSVGPILAVLLLSISSDGELIYELPDYAVAGDLLPAVFSTVLATAWEVLRALGLIVAAFLILQFTVLRLPAQRLWHIAVGLGYTFVGLVVFLSAVSVGFMPIGFKLGCELARADDRILVAVGFALGMVVVIAEPAVHVLNKQVEEITGGTVTKRTMLIALSVGVGTSIGLSVIRVIYGFSLLYYLIPGYLLSLGLSILVPKLYTAIAFDSGGVASGPLTSSFILPLIIGVCATMQGADQVLDSAFGVVAMVAMTPLITIQALGFRAVFSRALRERIMIRRIVDADDEQIICFAVKED